MKKIIAFLSLILVFGLSSCSTDVICMLNPDAESCQISYTPITSDTTGDVTSKDTLNVVDMAKDYDFTVTELHTFDYNGNQDIPYVDAEEFLYVMHQGLVYYTIDHGDTFTLNYSVAQGGNFLSRYTFTMILNPTDDTVYFSDMGFSRNFNTSPNIDYQTDLKVSNGDYVEGLKSKTMNLADYNIPMVEEDGVLFVPLYLANLLFTGDYLNVYQTGGDMYIIDDFQEATDILDNSALPNSVNEANLVQNTVNFTALFFDYYYGLKTYDEVTSYLDVLDQKGFNSTTSLVTLDALLLDFIYGLDDLHTGIADFGYDGVYQTATFTPPPGSKIRAFYTVYQSDTCSSREDEFVFTEYDDYYIMQINEFTLDTATYLKDNLTGLDPTKPIYIDLACNPGGNLIAVVELAMYLTSDPVQVGYQMTSTGEIIKQDYQLPVSRALNNTFYVFTSNMTFSAANLFTSMVKDNDLATIIGTPTSGGACAVLYTVLPNNMVITYSSTMAMINKDDQIIEAGISPDNEVDYSVNLLDTLDYMYTYYSSEVGFDLTNTSTASMVSISLDSHTLPDTLSIQQFDVKITDKDSGAVFNQTSYNDSSFVSQIALDDTYQNYHVTVTVTYVYLGVTITETIYNADIH